MPRIDPRRKKNVPPTHCRRERREPIVSFLRNLLFPTSQSSEHSIANDLLEAISPIWDQTITPTLLSEFGNVAALSAIFYAPEASENEVIFEIWDPKKIDSQPSAVFSLKGMQNVANKLPKSRSKAKIMTLKNWF